MRCCRRDNTVSLSKDAEATGGRGQRGWTDVERSCEKKGKGRQSRTTAKQRFKYPLEWNQLPSPPHQKYKTGAAPVLLLRHHIPSINPCNTNPYLCKRPAHLHTPVSSTPSSLNPPDLNSPYPKLTSLPICRKDGLVGRGGGPSPTPKFHHPRKPPRDRLHLISYEPLISLAQGRGAIYAHPQTEVPNGKNGWRACRWPVCAACIKTTRRFGLHFS